MDTISFTSPGLVTVNFDIEKYESFVASENQRDYFKFQSGSGLPTFLNSCAGSHAAFTILGEDKPVEGVITFVENFQQPVKGVPISLPENKVFLQRDNKEITSFLASSISSV